MGGSARSSPSAARVRCTRLRVARAFGIAQVIVPAQSSVFSALGCVHAQMGYSQQQTLRMPAEHWDVGLIDSVRQRLRARLAAPLIAAGHRPEALLVEETAAVRYHGQSYAIEVVKPDFSDPGRLGRDFLEQHRKLYGFATDEPWELSAIRMRVAAPCADIPTAARPSTGGEVSSTASPCIFDRLGEQMTRRFDRTAMALGGVVRGPAVIEDAFSTVVVPQARRGPASRPRCCSG